MTRFKSIANKTECETDCTKISKAQTITTKRNKNLGLVQVEDNKIQHIKSKNLSKMKTAKAENENRKLPAAHIKNINKIISDETKQIGNGTQNTKQPVNGKNGDKKAQSFQNQSLSQCMLQEDKEVNLSDGQDVK